MQRHAIIVFLCCLLIAGYFIYDNTQSVVEYRIFVPEPGIQYDIILNAYKHSGSTATGRILSKRADTFYVHEPLWQVALAAFYKGPCLYCKDFGLDSWPSTCVNDEDVCPNMTSIGAFPRTTDAGGEYTVSENWAVNHKTLNESSAFLQSILDCKFHHFAKFFFDPDNPISQKVNIDSIFYHGEGWNQFKECRNVKKLPFNYCLLKAETFCKMAKHRVIKLLRMTLDRLEPMLKTNPRLKVIHLFRDPRGIFNSQIGGGLHTVDDEKLKIVRGTVKALCERLLIDVRASYMFKAIYPDRFKVIQYELFFDQPIDDSARDLFEFAGMEYGSEHQKVIETKFNRKTNKTTGFHPFSYRTKLPWSVVRIFNEECSEVLDRLGYSRYEDNLHLNDLSKSGFARD